MFGDSTSELGSAFDSIIGSVPGIDEAMAFSVLLKTVASMPYDLVVFDTAPTGHTLKLLTFPGVLSTFLEKVGPLSSIFGKVRQLFSFSCSLILIHLLYPLILHLLSLSLNTLLIVAHINHFFIISLIS